MIMMMVMMMMVMMVASCTIDFFIKMTICHFPQFLCSMSVPPHSLTIHTAHRRTLCCTWQGCVIAGRRGVWQNVLQGSKMYCTWQGVLQGRDVSQGSRMYCRAGVYWSPNIPCWHRHQPLSVTLRTHIWVDHWIICMSWSYVWSYIRWHIWGDHWIICMSRTPMTMSGTYFICSSTPCQWVLGEQSNKKNCFF